MQPVSDTLKKFLRDNVPQNIDIEIHTVNEHPGIIEGFEVTATDPASLNVNVSAGEAILPSGDRVEVEATTITLTDGLSSLHGYRGDLIYLNTNGTVDVIEGEWAYPVTYPELPEGCLSIANISLPNLEDKIYQAYITDTRTFLDEPTMLTEADIVQGTFTIDRTCVSGSKFEIGTAIASELAFKLNNEDGIYDGVVFEGAVIYPKLSLTDYVFTVGEGELVTEVMKLGSFTIDSATEHLGTITIQALDRMVRFDKKYDSSLVYPTTIADIIEDACLNCNVILHTDVETLMNYNYTVPNRPEDDDITYRQIIQWCCEITGTSAYMDWDGELRLQGVEATEVVIDETDRYTSTIHKENVVITGVQVTATDESYHLEGSEEYVISISGNELIQTNVVLISCSLSNVLNDFIYRPFIATTKPLPYVYPLDKITIKDKNGISHESLITQNTFRLNGNTNLISRGETKVQSGWAKANPLTKRQRTIIHSIVDDGNKPLNDRIQSLLSFNELICQSFGVYFTEREQEDGSVKFYIHDQRTLEQSTNIYTFTAEGFAWTNTGWNDGNPTWQYGVSSDGNAIFNMISATGISVGKVGNDYSIKIKPDTVSFLHKVSEIMKLNGEKTEMTKVEIKNDLNIGKARIIPHDDGADIIIIG